MQGARDPLSNFFPCTLEFEGRTFKSAEHAYQYQKAEFFDRADLAYQVMMANDAAAAKRVFKPEKEKFKIRMHNRSWEWNRDRRWVMEDVLREKAKQVPEFREALIATGSRRLTHNVPDEYWGSIYYNRGKVEEGHNNFAILLERLRATLANSPLQRSTSTINHRTPSSTLTPRRLSPEFEGPISNRSQGNSVPIKQRLRKNGATGRTDNQNPRWAGSQMQSIAGLHTINHGTIKNRWKIPNITSRVAILGDSNINRVTTVSSRMNSVELHAFPGAKLMHLRKMLEVSKYTQGKSQEIILSFGINNRDDDLTENLEQLKSVFEAAAKVFPNAKIYILQINSSPNLTEQQKDCLSKINVALSKVSDLWEQKSRQLTVNLKRFKTLTKIPRRDFKIDARDTRFSIHWTTETANAIVSRWLGSLNLSTTRPSCPFQY